MLDGVNDRVVSMLLFLVLVLIVTTALIYGVIFITFSPDDPLVLGLSGPRAPAPPDYLILIEPTSTPEDIPTYPPTWTPKPTDTRLPTDTPTLTGTPTPLPTPTLTSTPLPTATSTVTQTPTPTDTSEPSPTMTPIPFFVDTYRDRQNCYDIGMKVTVKDINGLPMEKIMVEYGEEGISRFTAYTDVDGEAPLALIVDDVNNATKPHVWFARIWQNDAPASEYFKWQSDTIEDCDKDTAVQEKWIYFQRRF